MNERQPPAPSEVLTILESLGSHFMEPARKWQSEDPPSEGPSRKILWGFYATARPFGGFSEIIKTPPGSGKSRDATAYINAAWERGHKGLYLMLSHAAIEERLAKIKEDGKEGDWSHWRRHNDGCQRKENNEAGYLGSGDCTCGRGPLKADGPTLAPIEFILPSLPGLRRPLLPVVDEFDFWVIDEINFRRLLGNTVVGKADVDKVAATHPDETVKRVCSALGRLMEGIPEGRLEGPALYDALDGCLRAEGTTMRRLGAQMSSTMPTQSPWLVRDRPVNFPPVLVPVMCEEVDSWKAGEQFNPRIHLVTTPNGPELRVWWRKELQEQPFQEVIDDELVENEEGWLKPPYFLLDATADQSLLAEVFGGADERGIDPPPWPENVHAHQWADGIVSRRSLSIRQGSGTFSSRSLKDRARWYNRIMEQIKDFPRDWPIGLITHKAIQGEAEAVISGHGFTDVRSLHYGDERGSGQLEYVRVLVLLGLPIPNPNAFQEETQAFLYDSPLLEFDWGEEEQFLEMRGGRHEAVMTKGYWDEPVASYYKQKCQFGLYQVLHRIRPYNPQPYCRHIFIFTNMPIPEVKLDGVMRLPSSQRIHDRMERAVAILAELGSLEGCTVTQLVELLTTVEDPVPGIKKWVGRGAANLAQSAGCVFEPGVGSRPGRFVGQ